MRAIWYLAAMIVGVGTDILETGRIRALIEKGGASFLDHWFTEEEIRYCNAKVKPFVHFAARLSAKEAVAKSIRIEASMPVSWKDISIEKDENGAPRAVLSGGPARRASHLGVTAIHVSISHGDAYVTATAVAEKTEGAPV